MAEGHFCAACGVARDAFPRYPWHFCNACRDSAVDHKGRRVRCGNETMGGGFVFEIEGLAGVYACRGVICRIKGRPARLQEARFGGVVAEPWHGGPVGRTDLVDLTSRDPDFEALRRVDEPRRTSPRRQP